MRLCAAPAVPHAPGCPDASGPSTACAGTPSTERGPRCPRGASGWPRGRTLLLGNPRTRVRSAGGFGAHSLRAPRRADAWSESPAAELGGCASAEREIAGLGPGRGRERQQSVTMEGSGGHFMKFATLGALSRPRHHCEANQPAPSLGRGPGTRVRRRTRRPGAALPGPPSSRLHACDQREGRRGQREPPVPQAARLHTQRCPQPRAGGASPATRRAMGGGCAVVPAARRRWGSLAHPWGWSEANLPQGSRWF